MKTKTLIWTKQTAQYASGESVKIGKIKVGSIHWNAIDKDNNLRYVAQCILPGIKDSLLGKFPTEQEAKSKVEATVFAWFKEVSE